MRKYLKEIKELQELKELLSNRNMPEFIIVEGNNDLGEFFQIDGELFSDNELLENLKKWREWEVPVIIDDWCNRILNEDETEILYFPTHEDKMNYIRVEKIQELQEQKKHLVSQVLDGTESRGSLTLAEIREILGISEAST